MAKRKIEDEHRIFQDSWEIEFFCISGKKHDALCLICRKTITIPKRYSINRHYNTHHTEFSKNYPHPSKIREEKLVELKKGIFSEKQSMLRFTNKNELATKASYEVTHMLAKRMKPFSDAELIKNCMETVVNTLFCNFSNFKEIRDQISNLQLSDATCVRRIEHLGNQVFDSVINELIDCRFFSLALDSSVDISSTSQLILFVRFCSKDNIIKEDFLKVIPMKNQTRDGCPLMIGTKSGLVTLIKNKIVKPKLINFHCIIHQENLSCKFPNDFSVVMNKAIKIVNFIRARDLNHKKFKEFLSELNSQYSDIMFHTEVRWLSKGKVLERFFSLCEENKLFIHEQKGEFPEINSLEFWYKLAFLPDVTKSLNILQTNLQGEKKLIPHMAKNNIFSDDTDIETLKPQLLELLVTLKNEMNSRFNDIKNLRNAFRFIENPWAVTTKEIFEINIMNHNIGLLKNELIDLQEDITLKYIFNDKNNAMEFWNTLEEHQYPSLLSNVKAILTFFGSTYLCEAAFSKLTFIKNKYRNRLSDVHLDDLLRLSTSNTPVDINKIIKQTERYRPSTSKQH
ncbi:general transcription factor II-I repeat domain-containing protein 2B-like [Myzus persicae]|uniref:general transcription factor II-I repeat domain-containing protein 2B-like n=1 Tax=Myzus persicae TaxID=13164 RepID=UPI000B933885|nr:general transcription factor II-I repeat domain-containing protein 2B-like [Myzus persicae]